MILRSPRRRTRPRTRSSSSSLKEYENFFAICTRDSRDEDRSAPSRIVPVVAAGAKPKLEVVEVAALKHRSCVGR